MNKIVKNSNGCLYMNNVGLWKRNCRKRGESIKPKEKKCWECGSLSHRVEWHVPWLNNLQQCHECGLEFAKEIIEVDRSIKSSMGEFEDRF